MAARPRRAPRQDYTLLHTGTPTSTISQHDVITSRLAKIPNTTFPIPTECTANYFRKKGFHTPYFVPKGGEEMGMTKPEWKGGWEQMVHHVTQTAQASQLETVVPFDVDTQMEHASLSLQNWADYLTAPTASRRKILNLISLEISHTPLGKSVIRPKVVRDLDWVTQFWPTQPDSDPAPKVQLYCLMSPAKSYTDWHIDFGGTSVYYHIFTGSKTFVFMAPTEDNLARFEAWSKSPNQASEILENETAVKTTLYAGDTLFIPSGWLHAVYTGEDSIVIGGNFLHTLAVDMQLQIAHMEERLSIQQKFRFPRLEALHWYAVEWYSNQDRGYFQHLTKRELSGIGALCDWVLARCGRKNADIPPEVEGEEGARRLLWLLRCEIDRRCEAKRAVLQPQSDALMSDCVA